MLSGVIFDLKKYSLHDGPGIRTTVFLKGCPLSCWWCHNPESQRRQPELSVRPNRCQACTACLAVCPQNALSLASGPQTDRAQCDACGACAEACYFGARELVGRQVTVAEVLAQVLRDRPFFEQSGGGVTFSGGEPLLQARFLAALLRACREQGLHTVLDTSGYAAWSVLDGLRADVDLFLYDLKLMEDARHRRYTGVSNRRILDNLRRLAAAGQALWLRIPLIPGINDDEDNLRRSAAFLAGLPSVPRLELLGYHTLAEAKYAAIDRPFRLGGTQPPSAAALQQAAQIFAEYGLNAEWK